MRVIPNAYRQAILKDIRLSGRPTCNLEHVL